VRATDDNVAHAHCMLDTEGYRHTVKICNTYCFILQQWFLNAPQCYVIRTLPVLFQHASCYFLTFSKLVTKWFSTWALSSGRSSTIVLSLTTDLSRPNYMTYWVVSCTTAILLALFTTQFYYHRENLVRKRMRMCRRQETKPVLLNNWGQTA
jgi:hypothetical protein